MSTGQLLSVLKPRGFVRKAPQLLPEYLTVEGTLSTRFGNVPCEVHIDRTFHKFPIINLLPPLPERLLPIAPHIGPKGNLCYIASGAAVVDIYSPINQTLAALERAAEVLDQIMAGERVGDLQEEFYAFLPHGALYTDLANPETGRISMLSLNGGRGLVCTDDIERTQAKLSGLAQRFSEFTGITEKITTRQPPRPLINAWPPETVGQMLQWQSKLDDACRRKIQASIVKAYRAQEDMIAMVIESPTSQYAIAALDLQKCKRPTKTNQGIPIFEAPVLLMQVIQLDDRYLVQRNIPKRRTLAGLNINQVGCGTIGGYLAEMLVRAGAGSGGGTLRLIDFDTLQPGNIGRHRLGENYLEANKAEALATELKIGMTSANVCAAPHDVRTVNLAGSDLIIDATGEQAIGHWLAGLGQRSSTPTPLIHVWIDGPGAAVRTLTKTHASEGCFRCLCDYEREGDFLSVVGGVNPIFAGEGCEGPYVPFPASASVQAAALGLDTALAWVGQEAWPSLATRVINRAFDPLDADLSILPRPGCPACSS